MKKVWLLTHDNYIDRRIFFFADVFVEHNYDVKLFSGEYYDVLAKDDPSYVIRPEKCSIIRDYNISDTKIGDIEKEIVEEIITYQNNYYAKHSKWAKKIPFLSSDIRIELKNNDYNIGINKNSNILVYNKKTDSWIGLYSSDYNSEIIRCEKAIKKCLSGADIKKISNEYSLQIEITEENGNKKIWLHPINSCLLYIFQNNDNNLIEYSSMPIIDSSANEEFNEQRYKDFKDDVYDYSKIFLKVKEELQEEIPDIVYVADLTTLPIAIMLKEKYNCKIIMDCHEWWYKQTVLWEPYNKRKQLLSDYYEKELYPKCDLCITVGKFLAGRMQESIGSNFEVIYSCICNSFDVDSNNEEISLIKKYNLPENSKIVVFQGGMSSHRNLENLARSTKYLDEDSYLLLLTTGNYQDIFKHILKKEGNPKRVIWGGWIPQKELLKYTRKADLGVIPYTAENDYAECFVPNKLMEYITAKLPILFDETLQELKLVVGGNQFGFGTDLRNAESFGKAMNDLLHNKERLEQYRKNFNRCDNSFCYNGQKKNFEEMLKKYNIIEE